MSAEVAVRGKAGNYHIRLRLPGIGKANRILEAHDGTFDQPRYEPSGQ